MPIVVFFIILSLSFYVFYKIKFVRSPLPMERKYLSGKSGISLGLFVGLYGINQLFLHPSTITYIIGAIFIILGFFSVWAGIKSLRFYRPYVIKELEEMKQH
ncbi:YtpI family protein [Heyndrickxia sporothermodurans]|uniref:YtpI family protein n=1 Tax=Heyndrickxia sporothermodurans TaxID=46224 RepID=UPI00192BD0A8|nr:YtpI family protein [Heyndrickxia sporothermodurans]MBL5798556.1 YtpI family protein [Heyndrickxia sporothermodurans]MBL5817431.1 YtpI family protein [Heyndrickxia sporothermodurans]